MLEEGRAASLRPTTSTTSLSSAPTPVDSPSPFAERTPPLQDEQQLTRIHSSRLGAAEGFLAGGDTELDAVKVEGEELDKRLSAKEGKEGCLESAEEEWTYPEGGRGWIVVLGCFLFAGTILGNGLTWGVLVADLHANQHSDVPLSILNLVIGLSNFMQNATSFVSGRLADKYGYKLMIAIGAVCSFISLILSAVTSHSLPCLFIFNGFFLGVSLGMGMPSFLSLPAQWFSKRRGLASGITTAGTGIGGGVSSLIMRALLPRVGYRNTLLIYAGICGFVWIIAFQLIAVRLPPLKPGQTSRAPKTWLPRGIWRSPTWYSWVSCTTVGIFGYLTPYYFLTTYTTLKVPSLDPNSILPAVPLIISNFTCGFGRIFAGLVCDRIGPINSMFFSFFVGGLLQLVFWPFATTFGSIIAFAALEGFFGSWSMSLIPSSAAQLFGMDGLATIVGFGVLANSPGQFLGATLAGLVLSGSGGWYPSVAFYAGSMMVGGALCLLYGECGRMTESQRERKLILFSGFAARFANEPRLFARF
ncbi:major facilitator superfamily domain-containing protein [Leucosporidium creatinivorum]|uniref:Major facilitator superfamily domain-containing protein n=1 Tax=Leucosporidium creatinivorum TaxID=106004 RepID=A0A1Y2EJ21_9BASI|nr:major facilitator superfamily domain-containing protein [Leucosporidium creatinivorum]